MHVKEKKVELIELFYDLIYVYAIKNLTLLIEEPEGGVLTWDLFFVYIVTSMAVIQAWLFMTNYVNRYCTWRWYEYALVVFNMSAAVLMSNTIAVSWLESSMASICSMMTMVGCIIALYAIQIRKREADPRAAKQALGILGIVMAIYILALIINNMGYQEQSLMIVILNIILGMFVPLIRKARFNPEIVSFPHLVERLELLTIITFGEGIIGITEFFDIQNFTMLGPLSFMILIFMFGTYVCQVHLMCNHHQVTNPTRMVWGHYLIIIAINLVTVALLYFHNEEIDPYFTALMMIASLAFFQLALIPASKYFHPEFSRTKMDLAVTLAIIAVGAAIILMFPESTYAFMSGSLIITGGNFMYFLNRYLSNRIRRPKGQTAEA